MMTDVISKYFKQEGKPPILTEHKLKCCVKADCEITRKDTRNLTRPKHRLNQGNDFSRLSYDATELRNGIKVNSIGSY